MKRLFFIGLIAIIALILDQSNVGPPESDKELQAVSYQDASFPASQMGQEVLNSEAISEEQSVRRCLTLTRLHVQSTQATKSKANIGLAFKEGALRFGGHLVFAS